MSKSPHDEKITWREETGSYLTQTVSSSKNCFNRREYVETSEDFCMLKPKNFYNKNLKQT